MFAIAQNTHACIETLRDDIGEPRIRDAFDVSTRISRQKRGQHMAWQTSGFVARPDALIRMIRAIAEGRIGDRAKRAGRMPFHRDRVGANISRRVSPLARYFWNVPSNSACATTWPCIAFSNAALVGL